MQRLVQIKKRLFFAILDFEVNNAGYTMNHGTFRNKTSAFMKEDLV
jgi:hypothetical protein